MNQQDIQIAIEEATLILRAWTSIRNGNPDSVHLTPYVDEVRNWCIGFGEIIFLPTGMPARDRRREAEARSIAKIITMDQAILRARVRIMEAMIEVEREMPADTWAATKPWEAAAIASFINGCLKLDRPNKLRKEIIRRHHAGDSKTFPGNAALYKAIEASRVYEFPETMLGCFLSNSRDGPGRWVESTFRRRLSEYLTYIGCDPAEACAYVRRIEV